MHLTGTHSIGNVIETAKTTINWFRRRGVHTNKEPFIKAAMCGRAPQLNPLSAVPRNFVAGILGLGHENQGIRRGVQPEGGGEWDGDVSEATFSCDVLTGTLMPPILTARAVYMTSGGLTP